MKFSPSTIACLLGLPVTCKLVSQLEGLDICLVIGLHVHSLGINNSETFDEINTEDGASVRLDWLSKRFNRVNDKDVQIRILYVHTSM